MPLPSPGKNESQKAFIERCHSALTEEMKTIDLAVSDAIKKAAEELLANDSEIKIMVENCVRRQIKEMFTPNRKQDRTAMS